ncbi:MAG: hypothetical protein JO161_07830 [Planctomycetaceae bacterium]|nr:hypothetical protein [Planctomycetaceae bacterium]
MNDRIAMVNEHLDGLNQSLSPACKKPIEAKAAQLRDGRSWVGSDQIKKPLGCRIATGVLMSCECVRRGSQPLGISASPLQDALIDKEPGSLGRIRTAAVRRFEQDR